MANSRFLRWKEIQFRRFRWLSEVLARKNVSEENYSTKQSGGGSPMIWGAFSSPGKLQLLFFSGRQKTAAYVKMLNDLSLSQEERHLCGEEWIFNQDNASIHNASITKKYLLRQKIRLFDHPACSACINAIENLCGLIVAKVYEGGEQCSAISQPKNAILDQWEKYLYLNFRNQLIVCLAEILRLSKLTVDL